MTSALSAATGRARMLASYVALRARMARWYDEHALDDLLASLDARRSRGVIALDDAGAGIRMGERIARRAGLGPETCLFRALARYAALRQFGHRPTFVMGIDDADVDEGHAWVELDGAPFLEPRLPTFRRTFEHAPRP